MNGARLWLSVGDQQLAVHGQGRSHPQALARSVVDLVGNGIELLLAVAAQIRALGQVLAHQAVDVLVGAPLPGAVRVAEVHRNAGVGRQLLVARHLQALVVGQSLAHWLSNAIELVREGLQHAGRAGRLGGRQLDQHQQPAGALDQRAHGAGVARPLDQVTLPVAGELALGHLGWAHVNAEHVRDLPAPILAFAARGAFVSGLTQAGYQLALELAHGLGVDAVVDGLVRHAVRVALGVDARQCQGNLLGRPAQTQAMAHHAEQHALSIELASRASQHATLAAAIMRWGAGVVSIAGVTPQLAADGCRRASKYAGNGSDAQALLVQAGKGHSVFRLELAVGSRNVWHLLTLQVCRCCTSDLNPPGLFSLAH